jgi:hypothetical protein
MQTNLINMDKKRFGPSQSVDRCVGEAPMAARHCGRPR